MKPKFDVASPFDAGALQRAHGAAHVSFRRRGQHTVLEDLHQSGCLKVRFPRDEVIGWATAVVLNMSGGVTGGDRLDTQFVVRPHACVTITAQAAERLYRALPGSDPAIVRNRLTVEQGACAEWLPQETLLFEHCALDRQLDIELNQDAWFLGIEALVFGRAAMGERVAHAWLRDGIRIRRDGHLLMREVIRLDGAVDDIMQRRAVANGARAVATLIHCVPGAELATEPLRAALASAPAEAGASTWNGLLVARMLAPDAATLRCTIIAAIQALRGSRPLPRVWLC